MENVISILRIEFISDFFTYKGKSNFQEKKYFHFVGFDGKKLNKITVFDEDMIELIQVQGTYKITGIKAKINR